MATTTTVTSTAFGRTTTTTTTTTVVKPDIYNDKGCSNGPQQCSGYNAIVKCLVDLYAGVNVCQEIYLVDSNGNPLDLDRIDKIDIALRNEFDCAVMTTDDGLNVESMQTNYYGKLFTITPDNFWDKEDLYFELHNVEVTDNDKYLICPDKDHAIVLGKGNQGTTDLQGLQGLKENNDTCISHGHITFNPFFYTSDLYLEIKPNENNSGTCICTLNGLPQKITFNEKNKLINVLSGRDESILSIVSFDSNYTPSIAKLDMIELTCSNGYRNKGLIKLCYDGSKIPTINGNLVAEIMLKFNEHDPTEPDSVRIISCVPVGTVKKSYIIHEHHEEKKDEKEYVVDGVVYKYVEKLPNPGWNSMNIIYLVKSPMSREENMYNEYITVKINNNGIYSYHWEKLGDTTYDINVKQKDEKSVDIVLADNEADTDTIDNVFYPNAGTGDFLYE